MYFMVHRICELNRALHGIHVLHVLQKTTTKPYACTFKWRQEKYTNRRRRGQVWAMNLITHTSLRNGHLNALPRREACIHNNNHHVWAPLFWCTPYVTFLSPWEVDTKVWARRGGMEVQEKPHLGAHDKNRPSLQAQPQREACRD